MEILVSGYHNPNFLTITEYIEGAIRQQGHKVYVFDDRNHLFPARLRGRFPFLNRVSIQLINFSLRKIISLRKPDVVLVTGGNRILGSTIRKLDKKTTSILWTTDAPVDFRNISVSAKDYDYVFCQGTEAVEILAQQGVEARWLPMACQPQKHKPVKISREERPVFGSDIVFVGSYYPNRYALFKNLVDFDFGIWGPGWNKIKSDELRFHLKGAHTQPSDWVQIYSASKIVLAPHYQDPKGQFPVYQASPKIFEALACGAFVISDYQKDVFALFEDGRHLVGFETEAELRDKIRYYLDHPKKRKEIAKQGRIEALKNHKYVDRVSKLLTCVGKN